MYIDGQKTHPKSFSPHHTVRCGFDREGLATT